LLHLCFSDAHIRFILFDTLEHTEVDKSEHIEGSSLNDRLRRIITLSTYDIRGGEELAKEFEIS